MAVMAGSERERELVPALRKGGKRREGAKDRERKEWPSRAAHGRGGPNNISKLMSCGALQRGPVGSAPPFCIR